MSEDSTSNILVGKAPDGSTVTISLMDDVWGDVCPASSQYCCTLDKDHGPPWHIADNGAEIVEVWPV